MGDWEFVGCDLCGGNDSQTLFEVPCEDAPHGAAQIVECATCGLRYFSLRPSASAVIRRYPTVSAPIQADGAMPSSSEYGLFSHD